MDFANTAVPNTHHVSCIDTATGENRESAPRLTYELGNALNALNRSRSPSGGQHSLDTECNQSLERLS